MVDFSIAGQSSTSVTGLSTLQVGGLINSLVAAAEAPKFDKTAQISANTAQIAALKQLKGILSTFQNLAGNLKGPVGFNKESEDAFKFKTVSVTGSDNASDLIAITAENSAPKLDFEIEVTALAQKEIEVIAGATSQTADLTDNSGDADYIAPGTFQINGVDIVVPDGSSLVDIKAIINAETDNTGVTATIVQISDTEFDLQIVGNETGSSETITFTDFSTVFAGSGYTVTEQQAAGDASFIYNGDDANPITRSTNVFDDFIDGLTISLLDAAGGTTLNVSIGQDTSTPQTTILNFIASANQFLIFDAQQNAVDPDTGETASGALLNNDALLNTISKKITSIFNSTVTGVSGSISSLSDAGFEKQIFTPEEAVPNDPDSLTNQISLFAFTEADLNIELLNNFDDIQELFNIGFSTSKPSKLKLSNSDVNSVSLKNFEISVDFSQPNGQRFLVTPDDGSATFYLEYDALPGKPYSGTLTGADGTALEGLKMQYVGTGSAETIDVDLTIGIAQQINDYLEDVLDNEGIIDQKIASLQEQNENLKDDIVEIESDAAALKAQLQNQFAGYEAAIAAANNVADFLSAQTAAQNSNN